MFSQRIEVSPNLRWSRLDVEHSSSSACPNSLGVSGVASASVMPNPLTASFVRVGARAVKFRSTVFVAGGCRILCLDDQGCHFLFVFFRRVGALYTSSGKRPNCCTIAPCPRHHMAQCGENNDVPFMSPSSSFACRLYQMNTLSSYHALFRENDADLPNTPSTVD